MHYGSVVMCDKPTWIIGLVQKGHGEGLDTSSCDPGGIPQVSRRIVQPYTQRYTAPRNGVTSPWLSTRVEQVVSSMLWLGRDLPRSEGLG
jgi:hypothetical protein